MKITEVEIENFGKLHNRKIAFAPGLNVIYGNNEAGKSTLHQFMISMLFGMEMKRGKGKKEDDYNKYEPWNAPSYYCGAMRFTVDGKPFLLKRNFYHKDKSAYLKNEQDGEELSVEYGDLSMLLGDITQMAFENTWCVKQTGIVTDKDFAGFLNDYFANMEHTGDGNVSLQDAFKYLSMQKKKILQEKKRKEQERQQSIDKRKYVISILKQDLETLKNKENDAKLNIDLINKKSNQQNQKKEEVRKDIDATENQGEISDRKKVEKFSVQGKWILLFTGILGGLNLLTFGKYPIFLWGILEAILGASFFFTWIVEEKQLNNKGKNKEVKTTFNKCEERKTTFIARNEELDRGIVAWKGTLRAITDQIQEKQVQIENVEEELEELRQMTAKDVEIQQEEEAISLAERTIENLSSKLSQNSGSVLYEYASEILKDITNGKYTRLKVEENMELSIEKNGENIPLYKLSRGTLEQVYLAFRLAVGRFVAKDEEMFYAFDDTFALYDETRLAHTLRYIAKQSNQSFIFTCNRREIQILEKSHIPFHQITLAD